MRGNHVTLVGKKKEVESTSKVIHELAGLVKKGFAVNPSDIDHAVRYIAHTNKGIEELYRDQIYIPPSRKVIVPKTAEPEALRRGHTASTIS